MLRSAEISTVLTGYSGSGDKFHNLHWLPKIELSLDCFICERTHRTVKLELGAERAVCTSSSGHGPHYTAARIAAFDYTTERDVLSLRAIVDYWWAPFKDVKDDKPALPLTAHPWVRLHLGYLCVEPLKSEQKSIQTNLVRPCRLQCSAELAVSSAAPTLRLLT